MHCAPGTTPADRIDLEGYAYRTMGENVAFGTRAPGDVVALWIASPGHCRNLLNPDVREIGVRRSGAYWTQNFGARP